MLTRGVKMPQTHYFFFAFWGYADTLSVGETEAARELRQRAGEIVRAHGLLVVVDPERDAPALPAPVP